MRKEKGKSLISILIITLTFVISIIIILFVSMIISVSKHKYADFYIIDKEDKIPSIYNIVGNRKLYYFKSYIKDSVPYKVFKYKDNFDSRYDLNTYIKTLKDDYNFVAISDIDLSKDTGSIQLCSNSTFQDEIIILIIDYDKNKYSITISKNKGYVNMLKK